MTAFALKWTAAIAMLADHVAVVFLPSGTPLWIVLRCLGRLSFPLYAFLLAEGYFYTHNPRAYCRRLFGLALLSEIPFDLLATGQWLFWPRQSVFITLAAGLSGLILFDYFAVKNKPFPALLSMLGSALAVILCRSDYGAYGILFIFVFYRYRTQTRSLVFWYAAAVLVYAAGTVISVQQLLWGPISLCQLLALPLLLRYNREKGYSSKRMQYAFYFFYPAHLWLLLLLSRLASSI